MKTKVYCNQCRFLRHNNTGSGNYEVCSSNPIVWDMANRAVGCMVNISEKNANHDCNEFEQKHGVRDWLAVNFGQSPIDYHQ